MKWRLICLPLLLYCFLAATPLYPALSAVGVILHHDSHVPTGTLTNYVRKLIDSSCQNVSEINILSTSQGNLEINKLQSLNTNIPIHVDIKPESSHSMKLRIPASSTADLYFVSSLNLNQSCAQIVDYLTFAQTHEAAGLVPLVGQFDQTSVITVDNGQKAIEKNFGYAQKSNLIHFQIVENIRLISRHYLQLATSSIREIKLLAQKAGTCEEIFLNFVVAHFYPEMRNRIYKFVHKLQPVNFVRTGQAKTTCVRTFIDIMGYCPLFYQRKIFNKKIWINPNFKLVVELKKVALNAELQNQSQNRLLYSIEQELAPHIEAKSWFSSSEMTILLLLGIIAVGLLLAIFVLRSKIKALSTNLVVSKQRDCSGPHNSTSDIAA